MGVVVKNKAFALVALGAVVSASLVFGGSPAGAAACFSSFTNKTTDDGLGDSFAYAVYTDGSNVYAATYGGLSISADCASLSLPPPPPILPETGADPSLVLVGSGMSALLLFGGAAAILASRRKRASD
jgi:LPXTG-motif cell wall-anchored protein